MSAALISLFNLLAGLASLFGLYFSIAAWRRAGEATRAANEAKHAVRQTNAVEELRRLAGNANEMKREIQDSQWRTARLRCDDLVHGISFGKQRWIRLAPIDALNQVDSALGKLNSLNRAISVDPAALDEEMRTKLLGVCHDIFIRLAGAAGQIQQAVEERHND